MTLKNRVIWLTGASDGIGAALVAVLAKENCKLVLSARQKEQLEAVAKANALSDENCLILPLDLAQLEHVNDLVQQTIQKFGRIDFLIQNAGINQKSRAIGTLESVERNIMEVNYFGNIRLSKAVLPYMKQQKGGKIVVISSIIGKFGAPFLSTYAASKHALNGFYETLRYEVQQDGIDILIISPGFIRTNIAKKAITEDGTPFSQESNAQKYGMSPEKCAKKIVSSMKRSRYHRYIGGLELLFPYLHFFAPRPFFWLIRKLHKL